MNVSENVPEIQQSQIFNVSTQNISEPQYGIINTSSQQNIPENELNINVQTVENLSSIPNNLMSSNIPRSVIDEVIEEDVEMSDENKKEEIKTNIDALKSGLGSNIQTTDVKEQITWKADDLGEDSIYTWNKIRDFIDVVYDPETDNLYYEILEDLVDTYKTVTGLKKSELYDEYQKKLAKRNLKRMQEKREEKRESQKENIQQGFNPNKKSLSAARTEDWKDLEYFINHTYDIPNDDDGKYWTIKKKLIDKYPLFNDLKNSQDYAQFLINEKTKPRRTYKRREKRQKVGVGDDVSETQSVMSSQTHMYAMDQTGKVGQYDKRNLDKLTLSTIKEKKVGGKLPVIDEKGNIVAYKKKTTKTTGSKPKATVKYSGAGSLKDLMNKEDEK